MLASRKCRLDYSKFYCDVAERWLLAWNQNKHIACYTFYINSGKQSNLVHVLKA